MKQRHLFISHCLRPLADRRIAGRTTEQIKSRNRAGALWSAGRGGPLSCIPSKILTVSEVRAMNYGGILHPSAWTRKGKCRPDIVLGHGQWPKEIFTLLLLEPSLAVSRQPHHQLHLHAGWQDLQPAESPWSEYIACGRPQRLQKAMWESQPLKEAEWRAVRVLEQGMAMMDSLVI